MDAAKARERETSIAKLNVALAPLKKRVAELKKVKQLAANRAPSAIEKVQKTQLLKK